MERSGRLTPATLTETLRRSKVLREAAVIDVEAHRIGRELGFNGVLWRVIPEYDRPEPDAPVSLIAKLPQDSSITDTHGREARFYREFTQPIGIRRPRAYAAEPGLLLLEDLAPLNCGDVAAGCTSDEALMIVRHLARFHAWGWESPAIVSHDWLPRWPVHPERFYARFREYHPVFLERFAPQLNAGMRELTVRLVEAIPRVVEELRQAPPTLIHVDNHLDNFLYQLPDTVVLIDWPSAAAGPAAVDLCRFLSTSLASPVRRFVEDASLEDYLRILREEGVRSYRRSDLFPHLKLAALRWWAGMVTGFGASIPERLGERQAALQQIEIDRMSDVATDWQLSGVLDEL